MYYIHVIFIYCHWESLSSVCAQGNIYHFIGRRKELDFEQYILLMAQQPASSDRAKHWHLTIFKIRWARRSQIIFALAFFLLKFGHTNYIPEQKNNMSWLGFLFKK